MYWGTVADWAVATGTAIVAGVAVFQETVRAWFYRPKFDMATATEPPHCAMVPMSRPDGTVVAHSLYLRLWIMNVGNATARNVEVYAKQLSRRRLDGSVERIANFPPMNLKWANTLGMIYFPLISRDMGKHCDVAHIVEPTKRHLIPTENASFLDTEKTALAFDLQVVPNHKGHIVGPGSYLLSVLIAAENAHPVEKTLEITLDGKWSDEESKMLREFVGIKVH